MDNTEMIIILDTVIDTLENNRKVMGEILETITALNKELENILKGKE